MVPPAYAALLSAIMLAGCGQERGVSPGDAAAKPTTSVSQKVFAAPEWRMAENEKRDCTERGGKVINVGPFRKENCDMPLKDAGKVCTDDEQCIGKCLVAWNPQTDLAPEEGQCQRTEFSDLRANASFVDGQPMLVPIVD